eukprot:s1636_g6.t1
MDNSIETCRLIDAAVALALIVLLQAAGQLDYSQHPGLRNWFRIPQHCLRGLMQQVVSEVQGRPVGTLPILDDLAQLRGTLWNHWNGVWRQLGPFQRQQFSPLLLGLCAVLGQIPWLQRLPSSVSTIDAVGSGGSANLQRLEHEARTMDASRAAASEELPLHSSSRCIIDVEATCDSNRIVTLGKKVAAPGCVSSKPSRAAWKNMIRVVDDAAVETKDQTPADPQELQEETAVDEAAVEMKDQTPADPQEPLEETAVDEAAVELKDQTPADPQEPAEETATAEVPADSQELAATEADEEVADVADVPPEWMVVPERPELVEDDVLSPTQRTLSDVEATPGDVADVAAAETCPAPTTPQREHRPAPPTEPTEPDCWESFPETLPDSPREVSPAPPTEPPTESDTTQAEPSTSPNNRGSPHSLFGYATMLLGLQGTE